MVFSKTRSKRLTNHNTLLQPTNQLFRGRGFIETGTKQSVTDRLGRKALQQCQIWEK